MVKLTSEEIKNSLNQRLKTDGNTMNSFVRLVYGPSNETTRTYNPNPTQMTPEDWITRKPTPPPRTNQMKQMNQMNPDEWFSKKN
jgi:hypothetical protein